jgi:alpha/beta superfamily hydrolase
MKRNLLAAAALLFAVSAYAASMEEIVDMLVSAKTDGGTEQAGVLTIIKGDQPQALVLLMPGDPGVTRAEVADGKITNIRMRGHVFYRMRHLLVRPGLAAMLVDCRSDIGDACRENYLLSKERTADVAKLVARVKQDVPTVKKVWVAGHSLGGHSSASMARYGEGVVDGAIHASPVLAQNRTYSMLTTWDYSSAKVPQLFISQRDDPCVGTRASVVEGVARRYTIPIVIVTQSGGAKGPACGPYSEHSFAGAEQILMDTIAAAVDKGVDQFKH